MKKAVQFIVVEGGSGAGKTTQIRKLKKVLKDWMFIREPGGTAFGELVREAVQDHPRWKVNQYAALFAYSASRANLIREVVLPGIARGEKILIDRYWFSTYAYQGSEGVSQPLIENVSHMATDGLLPDLVLHYDLSPKRGLNRKMGNIDEDRYDMMELKFHEKVRRRYKRLEKKYPKIWNTIDASQSIDDVFQDTLEILLKYEVQILG